MRDIVFTNFCVTVYKKLFNLESITTTGIYYISKRNLKCH